MLHVLMWLVGVNHPYKASFTLLSPPQTACSQPHFTLINIVAEMQNAYKANLHKISRHISAAHEFAPRNQNGTSHKSLSRFDFVPRVPLFRFTRLWIFYFALCLCNYRKYILFEMTSTSGTNSFSARNEIHSSGTRSK